MNQGQLRSKFKQMKSLLGIFVNFELDFQRNHRDTDDIQYDDTAFEQLTGKIGIKVLISKYLISLAYEERINGIIGLINFSENTELVDKEIITLCTFDRHGNYSIRQEEHNCYDLTEISTLIDDLIIEAYLQLDLKINKKFDVAKLAE